MKPILFSIGGFPIRSYGLMIALGVVLGMSLAARIARKRLTGREEQVYDFAVYAVLAAIVGSRLWEVVFTWDYYGKHPGEILALWHGGLSIQGGILGGLLVAVWFARSRKIEFWPFADVLAPGVILGQAIGRVGCLLNGDAYARPTGSSWWGVIYQPGTPAYQVYGAQRLWPAETMEGIWDLIVLALLLRLMRGKRPDGTVTLAYAILYSVGRFLLEFLRTDSLGFLGTGFKTAQLASLATIAVAGLLLVHRAGRKQERAA